MSVKFVIGRAGSGKSRYCLDEIRAMLAEDPSGSPLILLVPQQSTFQAERELVSTPGIGGIARAQALSFHRLALRVMQEEGGTARVPIDEIGKKLLLHRILHKKQDDLNYYRQTYRQQGVLDRMGQLFTEWKRYAATPDLLENSLQDGAARGTYSQTLESKMRDLTLVYGEFERELQSQYLDGENVLSLLTEQIVGSDWLRSARIWIDGFHGFTPQELTVVERLMVRCQEVTITLCLDKSYDAGDPLHDQDLFHPTARTLRELRRRLAEFGLPGGETIQLPDPAEGRFAASSALAALEQRFGRIGAKSYIDTTGALDRQLVLTAAANRRAEVESVCRDMLRLARDEGVRFRDMAVMVRNMESYGDLLEIAMTDYGIPHFLDHKRSVMHHPFIEFIRSALEIVLYYWRYDAVFRCVKTDFLLPWTDGDVQAEQQARNEFDLLENYVLAFGIKGSRWTNGKPWTYRERMSLEGDDEANAAEAEHLKRINECRDRIVIPLGDLERKLKAAGTVTEQVTALYELLLDVHAPERLERLSERCKLEGKPEMAQAHMQLWGKVMDMLDQLVEMLGSERMDTELFASLLDTGFESISLGLVPPSLDEVLVGTLDRTRSGTVTHAYLLGVSEGVIPSRITEDGLLSETEREALANAGVNMAESAMRRLLDEEFLVYNAITTPSARLWISYPIADEEGKSVPPSEIVKRIRRLFPGLQLCTAAAEPSYDMPVEEQLAFAVRPKQALTHLGVQLKSYMQGQPMHPVWWTVYDMLQGSGRLAEPLRMLARALRHDNRERELAPVTGTLLYGDRLLASVSRMERFAACAFSHFASHGLRLKERRIFALEAPDIGQLFHAALSEFALGLIHDGLDWGSLSAEDCKRRSALVVEALTPKLPGEILLSSHRFRYVAHKLTDVIGRTSAVLAEHARRSEFKPLAAEVGFGPGQPLPSLTFPLKGGRSMDIIGRIDRVDRADTDKGMLLRIIDYKSSSHALNLSEVYYGLSLQMLTYLDVVVSNADNWLGKPGKPAGVLYFHVHNPLLVSTNRPSEEQAESAVRKKFRMKGLLTADPAVAGLMDSALLSGSGRSEVVPVGLTKDGGFYKGSSVATEDEWNQLRTFVRGQIHRIGEGIAGGQVDIAPYRYGGRTACSSCSFKPVCQFDPQFAGNLYRTLRKMNGDELRTAIYQAEAAAAEAAADEQMDQEGGRQHEGA